MIDRYLRAVQGARHRLAPFGSDLRSRRSQMVGNVNTGSYWRDRGPGARPAALYRSGAICDYADRGRRRRFAGVATPASPTTDLLVAARLARDVDQSSRPARR